MPDATEGMVAKALYSSLIFTGQRDKMQWVVKAQNLQTQIIYDLWNNQC